MPAAPSPSPTSLGALSQVTPTAGPGSWSEATWDHYPSLNQAQALAFDGEGGLWAGSPGGIVRWDPVTGVPTLHDFGVCENGPCGRSLIHGLALTDDEGQPVLWAATSDGVGRYQAGTWSVFHHSDGLPSDVAYAIAVAPDGTVWAGTDQGLAHFDGKAWVSLSSPELGFGGPIWSVGVAPDGTVWASTHTLGVLRYDFDRGESRLYGVEAGFAYPNARELAIDDNGLPWVHIGYDHVYRFDGERWQVAYESGGGQWVCDMAFADAGDRSASRLIGTCDGYRAYGVGVVMSSDAGWRTLSTDDGLLSDSITAVAAGPNGTIAAATSRGLMVRQAGDWRAFRWGPLLPDVRAIGVTPSGVAWFGFGDNAFRAAGGGLSKFDGDVWSYVDPLGLKGASNVRVIAVGPDGALWAGAGCSVVRQSNGPWEVVASCEETGSNIIAIVPSNGRDAVFATDTAVCRLGTGDLLCHEGLIPLAIAVAPDGGIWASQSPLADGGLVRFDGDRWVAETVPLDVIGALTATPKGEIVAAGIDRVVRRDVSGEWLPMGDALTGIRALHVSASGDLWALAARGVLRWTTGRWQTVFESGRVTVHTFTVAGEDLWLGTSTGAVRVSIPEER